jgi:hypothetical protein
MTQLLHQTTTATPEYPIHELGGILAVAAAAFDKTIADIKKPRIRLRQSHRLSISLNLSAGDYSS